MFGYWKRFHSPIFDYKLITNIVYCTKKVSY